MTIAPIGCDGVGGGGVRRLCRGCGYDVGRTITDGFARCPECGVDLLRETSVTPKRRVPAWVRALLALGWMSPLVLVPIMTAWIDSLVQYSDPGWVMVLLYIGSLLVCFGVWVFVERWRLEEGAVDRAMGRTVGVFAIHCGSLLLAFIGVVAVATLLGG